MIAVLDVSGVTQILLKKEKGDKFGKILKEATMVIVPDLYISELTNTFWKYHRAKLLTEDFCHSKINEGIDLIDDFVNSNELWKEAFGEGIKNDHPVYDMYYAVLARRNNGILITNDGDLAKICKKLKISYSS
jgi:predicted nucleic acid-binding protein